MDKTSLSTGEFARLCKTTKATLFHYEKLGLLKPCHVSGNGYRRYGIEQFFDFDMIAILKETGSSLEEIMQMRDNPDEANLLKLLEEKRHILRKERERLEIREIALGNVLDEMKEARELELDRFMVRELKEELLEITPISGGNHDNLAESISRYAAYVSSRDDNGRILHCSFGLIIDEAVINGAPYHELFYFNRSASNGAGNTCKPAGRYLLTAHKGNFPSHINCLKSMGEWCSAHELGIGGRIYAYDLAGFLRPQTMDNYLVKYAILLEES